MHEAADGCSPPSAVPRLEETNCHPHTVKGKGERLTSPAHKTTDQDSSVLRQSGQGEGFAVASVLLAITYIHVGGQQRCLCRACVWGGPEIPPLGLSERKKAISKKESDSPDQSQ